MHPRVDLGVERGVLQGGSCVEPPRTLAHVLLFEVEVDCCGEGYAEDEYQTQELTKHVLEASFVYSKRVK